MENYNSDFPSMNNIYNSTKWEQIKNKEIEINKSLPLQYLNPSNNDGYSDIDSSFYSLTGNKIDAKKIKHGNMQKFLKKNVTQNTNIDNYIIDNSVTTNLYNNKSELEQFFQPVKDLNLVNGTVYNDDKIKNRTIDNLTNIQNNTFPIQQIKVGPGLNNGYNGKSNSGFHDFNTNIYSRPKNIDELRGKTNQKNRTFNNDYKAPKKNISKRGNVVSLSKNRPETVFKQTKDNYFKTTGAVLKNSKRPLQNIKATNKQDSHIEYKGNIKYAKPGLGENDTYGKENVLVYDNERQTTEDKTSITNVNSIVKAIISPITDVIKFSTKEYTIKSARESGGNIKGVVEKMTTYDPVNHIAKTTVKETTIHDSQNTNLTGAKETYSANQDIAKTTVKETTIHDAENTNLTGAKETYSASQDIAKTTVKETTVHDNNYSVVTGAKETYVEYDDKMKTTVKETTPKIDSVRNIGQVKYKTYVYDPDIVAKTTVKETTISGKSEYGFLGGLLNRLVGGYANKVINLNNTNKQFTSQYSSYGNVSSVNDHRQSNRKSYYDMEIDDTREKILIAAGHTPNPGNMNINIDPDDINMKVDKKANHADDYGNISKIYNEPIPIENVKKSVTKENIQENAFKERLDNSIMSSLKTNELNIPINPI